MKQTDKILLYMQTEGEITPLDALREFNCMRLAARISELRCAAFKRQVRVLRNGGGRMSGMENLKEAMKKMGASGQLAESRAVPMVVTILANKENHLTAWKLFEEMVNNVRAQQASNTNRAQSLAFEEERINRKRREVEKREKAIADKEAEIAHIKEEILDMRNAGGKRPIPPRNGL